MAVAATPIFGSGILFNPASFERAAVNPFLATGFFQSRVDVLFP